MKYNKTNYPNIFWYNTKKGKRYYVRRSYRLNGKKKEATTSNLKSLQEARLALSEIEQKIENNDFAYNKNLTVDQYWPMYCDKRIEKGKWAPDTAANKDSIYENHFKERYGNVKMKDIQRDTYEEYINNMLKSYAKQTVVQIHSVLNAMLNHAQHNKLILDNPIDKIDIGNSSVKPRNKHVPLDIFKQWDKTAREILDDFDYLAVRITYLGARKSEDYGITLGNLTKQPDGNYLIKLNDSRTYRRPNGGSMKTYGSERYIMADELTSELIDKAIPKVNAIAKKYGRILGPNDYLFITDYENAHKKNLGKPWPIYRIDGLFKQINKASGLHITPHMMRHFFTTQGQIAKVPIEHMAAALGHSTSYMTQKYTHIKDEVASSVTESFMKSIQ